MTDDKDWMSMSRRELLAAAGLGVAGTVGLASGAARRASAQPVSEPVLNLGADNFAYYQSGIHVGATDALVELNTNDLDIAGKDFVDSGGFLAVGQSTGVLSQERISTTSTSYVNSNSHHEWDTKWDAWKPPGAQGAVLSTLVLTNSDGDVRLRNIDDGETVHEELDISANANVNLGPTDYTPATTSSTRRIRMEVRTNDGATATRIQRTNVNSGVSF